MNATRSSFNKPRSYRMGDEWLYYAEWTFYTALAAVLISQIFLIDSVVTMREVALVMTGAVFGLMVSGAATPITTLVQYLRGMQGASEIQTTNIIPFVRNRASDIKAQNRKNRHAA